MTNKQLARLARKQFSDSHFAEFQFLANCASFYANQVDKFIRRLEEVRQQPTQGHHPVAAAKAAPSRRQSSGTRVKP